FSFGHIVDLSIFSRSQMPGPSSKKFCYSPVPNPFGCCDIIDNPQNPPMRTFKNKDTISDMDYLSNLRSDGLLNIFPFFDHLDLDEISLLSQKMYLLSVRFRKTASGRKRE
ncbi:hypothetical protein PENTCL1PPCAC_1773, partial [Pristionchus entomophagus]